jgi:hypothetical protein
MKLTAKQEAFAKCLADGMTQADAYRAAYTVRASTKLDSIHDAASKTAAKPGVVQRVKELKAALEALELWTREKSVKGLIEAFDLAKAKGHPVAMTGAVRELNAMHGFEAPKKILVEAGDALDVQSLDIETMKKIMHARDAKKAN